MMPDYGASSGALALAQQLSIDRILDGLKASGETACMAPDESILRHSYSVLQHSYETLRVAFGELYLAGKEIEARSEERLGTIARLEQENARLRESLARAEAAKDAQAEQLKQASEWLQKLIFDS